MVKIRPPYTVWYVRALRGATVELLRKNVSVVTNADGIYNIPLKDSGAVMLSVSFVGYLTKDVRVAANATVMNIKLEDDVKG